MRGVAIVAASLLALTSQLALSENLSSAVSGASPQTRELGFLEALDLIVIRSTAVSIQEANVGATRARDLPVRLRFVPSLGFDAKQSTNVTAGIDGTISNRQVEAYSDFNFFRGGADYAGLKAAESDEQTQQATLENTLLSAEDSGVTSLIALIQRRQEVGILTGIVKTQKDSLAIAEQRYRGGYLPLQEAEKVSIDLANAYSRLSDAQVSLATAVNALENLLGHTQLVNEWPWKQRLTVLKDKGEESMGELLAKRPDWRAAQARVEAETSRTSRNWRLLLPSLDGTLAYGYYSNLSPAGSGAVGWQGILTLNLPFFDRLTAYSGARAQAFATQAAEAQFEQIRRDAKQDWESARQVYEIARTSAVERERTLSLSLKLYQDNLKRFQSGRISANDLKLDQNRLSDSELFAVQGWAQAHQAYFRLCRARGLRLAACLQEQ
jgi:outer membrane protein TolC